VVDAISKVNLSSISKVNTSLNPGPRHSYVKLDFVQY
jgi:hypothetical protein